MKAIEMPVFRLTSDCIWNSFRSSGKRHLILTGTRVSIPSLQRYMDKESEWISIGETGYPETGYQEYYNEILRLMDKKRLVAVVREQSQPFLEELRSREDVFLVDLDDPFGNMGCVIMASGLGRRFGGNKLMADFKGKPLLQWILDVTEGIFGRRIVVTRHEEVRKLCLRQEIDVIYHTLPCRNDTVRLGLQEIARDVEGCMFCPGDQPLLQMDTVASLALNAVNEGKMIWRAAYGDNEGSPVLFPKWTFQELLTLPEGKGGSYIVKKYPGQVRSLSVRDRYELMDIDTPEDLKLLSEH